MYNVESYITDCLESIISTTENIEIICINDGSTDNSLIILKDYQKKDKRIRIYSQTNQGLSSARNKGIELSKSEYLMFIDADDTIINKGISRIINFNQNKDFDLIIFNHCKNKSLVETKPIKLISTNKKEIFEGVLSGEISTSVCYALIKKDILINESISFPVEKTIDINESLFSVTSATVSFK